MTTNLRVAWWMKTALGRWLATNTDFFAKWWYRNMLGVIHAEAKDEHERMQVELTIAADLYVQSLGDPIGREEALTTLIGAVCAWRNTKARWVKTRADLETEILAWGKEEA